jgi:hypothetical protein
MLRISQRRRCGSAKYSSVTTGKKIANCRELKSMSLIDERDARAATIADR